MTRMKIGVDQFDFNQLPADDGDVIRLHSKSFSRAAKFLPRQIRQDAERLYAWCRWCDDAVDQSPNAAAAAERIRLLRADVETVAAGGPPRHQASRWLAEVVQRYSIPKQLCLDLLDGMEMDIEHRQPKDIDELELYCYRAAGSVGMMMSHLLGARDPQALQRAKALGIAMQLTNIARDVADDWRMGRLYLPATWIACPENRDTELSPESVQAAVDEAIGLSETYYAIGIDGLRFLPTDVRPSIWVAGAMYREISRGIAREQFNVLDGRYRVSAANKLRIAAVGTWKWITQRLGFAKPPEGAFQMTNQTSDASFVVSLGLSLTFAMGAAMFVMVGFNPKQPDAYSYLPWVYSLTSAALAAVTGFIARRFLVESDSPN